MFATQTAKAAGAEVKRLVDTLKIDCDYDPNGYFFAVRERPKFKALEERAKDTIALLQEGTPSGLGQVFYRLSVPIAGIALALLAIPLAYVNPRLGRSINLIIAILLLMISLKNDLVDGSSSSSNCLACASHRMC